MKFFKKPDWLTVDADINSAEIEAIVKRADGTIDWDESRHLYWHKNPIRLAWWVLKNGKEGRRSLQRRKRLQGGVTYGNSLYKSG